MRFQPFRTALAGLSAALALAVPNLAEAGIFRAYLSELGVDTNPCTLPQPCRLLPAALTAVNAGGEIWMLDSANFNGSTVIINKSVTILAIPGVVGSMVANNGDAVLVNGAGARVTLKNLVFVNLAGGSTSGVAMVQGSSLTIESSSFTGLPLAAVNITAIGTKTQILNSTFNANNIGVQVAGGVVTLIDNNFVNNTTAVRASGNGGASAFPPNGTTRVRVSGGNVLDNNTNFVMDNTSTRASGQCNGSNIFVRNTVTESGYTTRVNVTGASDLNGGCTPGQFTIDSFNSPTP